jgi:hypothetical protein
MKKILIILSILFSFISFAQDSQLIENTWYLDKITLNGIDYSHNITDEIPYVELEFNLNLMRLETTCCNFGTGFVSFDDVNSNFSFDEDFYVWITECFDGINYLFESKYFDFYIINDNPYSYTITTNSDTLLLTITSANGDQAIYGNSILSNQELNVADFNIYPNPASDKITIESIDGYSIKMIKVYDILGRIVLEQNNSSNQLDVSNLSSGLLFIQIETSKGSLVKKVIKE